MKRVASIGVLCLGLALIPGMAKADFNFVIPSAYIPDACAFGTCVQFTHSQLLLQIQQAYATVQNFKNIQNMAGMQGAVQQVIGIVNSAQAAKSEQTANAAAQQVLDTEGVTLQRISSIDAQAQSASGTQQQAQVQNLYASSLVSEVNKANTLLATQVTQKEAEDEYAVDSMLTETGYGSDIDTGDSL